MNISDYSDQELLQEVQRRGLPSPGTVMEMLRGNVICLSRGLAQDIATELGRYYSAVDNILYDRYSSPWELEQHLQDIERFVETLTFGK